MVDFTTAAQNRAWLSGDSIRDPDLASEESETVSYEGVADALALGAPGNPVDVRIFAKPKTLNNRRMGVALARAATIEDAIERAKAAAARVRIRYSK